LPRSSESVVSDSRVVPTEDGGVESSSSFIILLVHPASAGRRGCSEPWLDPKPSSMAGRRPICCSFRSAATGGPCFTH
jgi:hypothetical protein